MVWCYYLLLSGFRVPVEVRPEAQEDLGRSDMKQAMMWALATLLGVVAHSITDGWAVAQCEPEWQAFDPSTLAYPGVDGSVRAIANWDEDGPGPMASRLVVGGYFKVAGSTAANHIAVFDPATDQWAAMGEGMDNAVKALAVLADGDVVAGGGFSMAGGAVAKHIARWDAATGTWSPMGTGMNGWVHALAALSFPEGDLVAGGGFTSAGGVDALHIACWDSVAGSWTPMGAGVSGSVQALTALPNGDIIAGGNFLKAGGIDANRIARWDGAAGVWSSLGSGLSGEVHAIAPIPTSAGDVTVGGLFSVAGGVGANNIARWNEAAGEWTPMGTGMKGSDVDPRVFALTPLPNGDVVAGGWFAKAGDVDASKVARWNGSTGAWTSMGKGMSTGIGSPSVYALTMLSDGVVYAGGSFTTAGDVGVGSIAGWHDVAGAWGPTGTGMNLRVRAVATLPTFPGDLVVGGEFTLAGGVIANRIARWNGATAKWTAMSTGMDNVVCSITALPSGDLVAGGFFSKAGGVDANHVAMWSNSTEQWSPMGTGMDNMVLELVTLPTLTGDVVAGGSFTKAGGVTASRIARWNNATGTWSPMGTGMDNVVYAIAALGAPSGDVVAGGAFNKAGGVSAKSVARWSSAAGAWNPMGSGMSQQVYAVVALPAPVGDVVAGGAFATAGGVYANSIARWNDAKGEWSAMGEGMSGGTGGYSYVFALALLPNGDLIAGGDFVAAGGVVVKNIARWDYVTGVWDSMGSGMNRSVLDVAVFPSGGGDIIAGGEFITSGSVVTPYFARYACEAPPACYADCDGSGALNIDDFTCFQSLYVLSDPEADCDGSGSLDIDDFICFQTLFAIGC